MSFPGLEPVFVRVPFSECQCKVDATRKAILINLDTDHIIQAIEGGTTEKSPEGYTNFRDFSDNEFDKVARELLDKGFPQDQVAVLLTYRCMKE